MKSMFRVLLVAAAIALTGCAASVNRPDGGVGTMTLTPRAAQKIVLTVQGSQQASASSDWETLRAQWRESMGVAGEGGGPGIQLRGHGLARWSGRSDPRQGHRERLPLRVGRRALRSGGVHRAMRSWWRRRNSWNCPATS